MALGENQNKIQYTVTTSDSTFDFPYKYWDSSEIQVTKLASGVETSPSFTLSPTNGDTKNGCTVTLDVAVTSCTITIERIVAYESEADYQRGALSPTGLTEQFDKGAAMSQQLNDGFSRSIRVPTTDPSGLNYEIGTVTDRSNKVLGFDASGNVSNVSLATTGTLGADTDKGVEISSNILSAKVDDTSTEFDGSGNISVKDGGVTTAMVASPTGSDTNIVTGTKGASGQLVGWNADGDAVDSGFDVTDSDSLGTSDTTLATQGNIKAYVDGTVDLSEDGYAILPSGLIVQWGVEAKTVTGDLSITFPYASMTGALSVQVSQEYTTATGVEVEVVKSYNATGMTTTSANFHATDYKVHWMVIGY